MSESKPPAGPKVFRFTRCEYDPATGTAELGYAFDQGAELVERLVFPYQPWPSDASRQAAFMHALDWLHWIAGVSYWKTCVPEMLAFDDRVPDGTATRFLGSVYVDGMAEFAHANGLALRDRVNFRHGDEPPSQCALDLPDRMLVAIGGGKDSLVTLETLRTAGREVQPFCVGDSELIGDTVKVSGLPLIRIRRRLSPRLQQMNDAGALNGHVPVTAINSAIGVCTALLYGYRNVVFSNESSASEPTLVDGLGNPVNHQWSKSLEFEAGFRAQLERAWGAGVQYFSLLRPLTEMAIAERFSRMTEYHPVFSSCNRNFHLDGARTRGRWCGDCPKCRFTTLALAPFMSPEAVCHILGRNLLDDPGQEEGFRALCRLGANKPLECVGTVNECRAAIYRLQATDGWSQVAIVGALGPEIAALNPPGLEELLAQRSEHCIPDPELVNALG